MKKNVKLLFHLGFWIYFPVSNVLAKWSEQVGFFSNMSGQTSKNIFEIFQDKIKFLITPFDPTSSILEISNFFGVFFHLLLYLLLPIGVFYVFYYVFVPGYWKTKRNNKLISPIVFLVVIPFTITTIFRFITIRVAFNYSYYLSLTYIYSITFAFLGSLFKLIDIWILQEKQINQNLKSELALLKNQINPHFLFNTLNNVDSLTRSNPEKASETIVRLSGILRYMIYDTKIELVSLSNEIKHIESYIDLQKLQFANKKLVSFSVKGDSDVIQIAPMLFIPFVENAFKHCNNKNLQNAISITFSIARGVVNFECNNIFDKTDKITKDSASGIGLININRRLDLIYPGNYSLNIKEENGSFNVKLSINTYEH